MQYQEINLFNTAFLPPFGQKRPPSLYVREDIIDTQKIKKVCEPDVEWNIVDYGEHAFYMTWIPLENRSVSLKNGQIRQLGFYVLTDTPSIFRTARDANQFHWLPTYWDKMFLVTTPVLKYVPTASQYTYDMQIDYCVPNMYPISKILLPDHSIHSTWQSMLQTQSYTIGNGLTVFLTMIKAGHVSPTLGKACIHKLFRQYGTDLLQEVQDRWSELYYGHPIVHVCDNPQFYCAMGDPCVPLDVFQLFASTSTEHDVVMNVAHGNTRIVSTLRSVLLTYFRPYWWEQAMGDAWYECPMDINVEDEYAPNVASFFLSVIRNRTTWKWWLNHSEEYLESMSMLLSKYHSSTRLLEFLLQPILHFYEHAEEYTPTLCYSRIRHLWKQILMHFDSECEHTIQMIQRWSLRFTFIHTLKTGGYISQPGWDFDAPVAFLKDVLNIYGEKCRLFQRISLKIYTEYDRMILRVYPDLQNSRPVLRSNYTTIQVLRMAPYHSMFNVFYRTILKPRMKSRVLGIYHGFGMLENKTTTVEEWKRISGLHTVGFLVLDHIKDHMDLLYA